jgi:hypothetical protein
LRFTPAASRPVPAPTSRAHAQQRRGYGRCRCRVADPHLAEDDEIRSARPRPLDRAAPRLQGERQLVVGHRRLAREVARAASGLIGGHPRDVMFGQRAGVDDMQLHAEFTCQYRNRRATGGKVMQHLNRHVGGISGDALRGDAVVAGKQNDRRASGTGAVRRLQRRQLDRQCFQHAERTRRLGQYVLARFGGGTMRLRRLRTASFEPLHSSRLQSQ